MNVLSAPLWFLLSPALPRSRIPPEFQSEIDSGAIPHLNDLASQGAVSAPGSEKGCIVYLFLVTAIFICLAVLGFGLFLAFTGVTSETTIKMSEFEMQTDLAGIAMVALALIFYAAIGKIILKQAD